MFVYRISINCNGSYDERLKVNDFFDNHLEGGCCSNINWRGKYPKQNYSGIPKGDAAPFTDSLYFTLDDDVIRFKLMFSEQTVSVEEISYAIFKFDSKLLFKYYH